MFDFTDTMVAQIHNEEKFECMTTSVNIAYTHCFGFDAVGHHCTCIMRIVPNISAVCIPIASLVNAVILYDESMKYS